MRGGAAVAEVLKREGVDRVFCFPANPLIDDAAAAGIRPIVAREERTLINMADAYTRVSNGHRIGVCMVQGGPGIEHAFGGVAQAYADSTPILLLPSGPARSRLGLRTSFDAVTSYGHITRWAARFDIAAAIPDQMRRAFAQLRSGRPGPVLLEMPADVIGEELDDGAFAYRPPSCPRTAADPAAVAEVVRLLLAAERPLLHVGQGVLWAEATDELREFVDLVQAPAMTTFAGKSALPEDHPLAIGAGGASLSPGVHYHLPRCDLVFSIGASLARTLGSCAIPPGKRIVQCTADASDLNMEYALEGALVGDARLVLAQLCEEVRRQAGAEGRRADRRAAAENAEVRQRALQEWLPRLTSDEVPINPYRVVWDLMHTVDRTRTIVTHDSGYPRDQLAPFFESLVPRGYLGWGNTTPLGSSIGLALGARVAAPEKLVVNVLGDAAFGQAGLDVETAVRERIPILSVLLNNSQMGNYEKMQPVAQERYDIKRLSGDYTGVASALGAYAERVERPVDIVPALWRAQEEVAAGRPAVLEIITRAEPLVLRG